MAHERGFFNHIWYKLLDEEGIPIPTASVWIYDYKNPLTQLTLFDENGDVLTQPISTDTEGILEFYVKDHIRSAVDGYEWDTQFIISWSKDDKSGLIRGDHLWGEFKSVNVSGNLSRLNKAISNFYGWTIDTHVDFEFGSTNRCGSSSSSSSSLSSSSSSSVSFSSSSSSTSSSSSSTSTSTPCVSGFAETAGDPLGIWQNGPGWDNSNPNSIYAYQPEVNGDWSHYIEPSGGGDLPFQYQYTPRAKITVFNDVGWSPTIRWVRLYDVMDNILASTGTGSFALSGGDGVPTVVKFNSIDYSNGFPLHTVRSEGQSQKHYISSIVLIDTCASSSSSSTSTGGGP